MEARGEDFGEEVDEFFCGAAAGIFFRVVLGDVEAEQIFVLGEFEERGANVFEAQAAAARDVDSGKIFLSDDVGIQMKHKVVRFGVHVGKSFLRRARAALELNVSRIVVAHGGLGQIFLLGRIEPLEAEKRDIRLAHKRRLSPEAHQLRSIHRAPL